MNPALDAAKVYDAVVIGGGFYGAAIAIYLAKNRGFKNILLIEKESQLMMRASYNNQARVHNGYHYPRSFTTAFRSRINLPKFVHDWPQAVNKDFTNLYAVARINSKVSAKQFERFCHQIGAQIADASPEQQAMFNPVLIEAVFKTEEFSFDSTKLADWALKEIKVAQIEVLFTGKVVSIKKSDSSLNKVTIDSAHLISEIKAKRVFNCTYSGLNQFSGTQLFTSANLKQEITEMALIRLPDELIDLGITVMDGPFFSIMPFPARNLHTLSHVRYTPHFFWNDRLGLDPYKQLTDYDKTSRFDRMIRDTSRYVPAVQNALYVDSIFEVKTILAKNEVDDGRPILFERHPELHKCYSILGGKIDNIYDVLEKLDAEKF